MKKILISLIVLSLISLIISPALAREPLKGAGLDPAKLQELGTKMIGKRVSAINKYDGFLAQTKLISEPTLSQVRGELSRVNSELDVLKAKILAETDIPTLKADVKSIVTNYKVYQVFLPQSAGLVATDRLKTLNVKLGEVKDKISAKADELEGQGKDVSAIRALLEQAASSLAVAQPAIAVAESKFAAMTISDPEGSRTLKLEGREALIDARQAFGEARKYMREAIEQMKALK